MPKTRLNRAHTFVFCALLAGLVQSGASAQGEPVARKPAVGAKVKSKPAVSKAKADDDTDKAGDGKGGDAKADDSKGSDGKPKANKKSNKKGGKGGKGGDSDSDSDGTSDSTGTDSDDGTDDSESSDGESSDGESSDSQTDVSEPDPIASGDVADANTSTGFAAPDATAVDGAPQAAPAGTTTTPDPSGGAASVRPNEQVIGDDLPDVDEPAMSPNI